MKKASDLIYFIIDVCVCGGGGVDTKGMCPPTPFEDIMSSGVAKGGPGRARARPKHYVRPALVAQSRKKRARARG